MSPTDGGPGYGELAATLIARHPDEAAEVMETAANADVAGLLDREPASSVVAVLERLSPDKASEAIRMLGDRRTSQVLGLMDPHRASALLSRLDADVREKNLAVIEPDTAENLRAMAEFPPGTVGSLMDPRVTVFRPGTTVGEAIKRLRTLDRKRIQDLFLVDESGRLVGSVPLQTLALATRDTRLGDLATAPVAAAQATWRREAVVEELERHRVGSLPVADFDGRVIGVLRQDELLRTAKAEAAANMVAMVGASREERALSSSLFVVRKRLPWLQINLLTAFLAASVVGAFEGTIARFTALAVLLPVVAGQSGNTGAQALAVTMRGLALREITLRSWPRVAVKELLAGLMNGLAVAATTAAGVYVWSRSFGLVVVIGTSMILSMALAGLAGGMVPIVLSSLRQDPAQSASIVLTTVTDVVGFLSFLGIATLLASML